MTNVPKPIVVEYQYCKSTNLIRNTDNMKLQQLWELCDLGDYEAIPEAMRRYLESRKNEILAIEPPPIEPPHSYQRPAIEPPSYYDQLIQNRQIILSPPPPPSRSPVRCLEPIVISTSPSPPPSLPSPATSKADKPNGPTSMKELLSSMSKPSSKAHRKCRTRIQPKAEGRRVGRRVGMH